MSWSKKLNNLLNDAIEHPEKRLKIEKSIKKTYSQKCAFMVLDMCGFSRTTHTSGIFDFMLMIHQMRLICVPTIKSYNGMLIKEEADNLFCLFKDVENAINACQKIIEKLNGTNNILPKDKQIHVSVGIGYGDILNIENKDIFGDQINQACKLGEDIAEENEILLTENAYKAEKQKTKYKFSKNNISISGLKLKYYKVIL